MTVRNELLLAGHSHVFAMGVPFGYEGERDVKLIEDGPVKVHAVVEKWSGTRLPPYWAAVAGASTGRTVAIVWNGNQHNAAFLLRPEPLFDVHVAAVPARDPEAAVLVPQAAVKAYFHSSLAELRAVIGRIRSAGARDVIVVGTPAPKGDPMFLEGVVRNSAYFRDLAAKMGLAPEAIRVSPALLRTKLWHLLQVLMAELARAEGARFMPVPSDTLEADGTLKRIYWAEHDATHANAAYGKRVMAMLRESAVAAAA